MWQHLYPVLPCMHRVVEIQPLKTTAHTQQLSLPSCIITSGTADGALNTQWRRRYNLRPDSLYHKTTFSKYFYSHTVLNLSLKAIWISISQKLVKLWSWIGVSHLIGSSVISKAYTCLLLSFVYCHVLPVQWHCHFGQFNRFYLLTYCTYHWFSRCLPCIIQ